MTFPGSNNWNKKKHCVITYFGPLYFHRRDKGGNLVGLVTAYHPSKQCWDKARHT